VSVVNFVRYSDFPYLDASPAQAIEDVSQGYSTTGPSGVGQLSEFIHVRDVMSSRLSTSHTREYRICN
jgi:hypothetical protein